MGPIELLKMQHREVEALFPKIRAAEGAERVRLCAKLAEDLTVHANLEELIFYPEAKARGIDHAVERSVHDHAEVKEQVALLLELKQNDPRLLETVARIEYLLAKHVEEEERVVFPQFEAREAPERMQTIHDAMTRAEDDLRQQDLLQLAEAAS